MLHFKFRTCTSRSLCKVIAMDTILEQENISIYVFVCISNYLYTWHELKSYHLISYVRLRSSDYVWRCAMTAWDCLSPPINVKTNFGQSSRSRASSTSGAVRAREELWVRRMNATQCGAMCGSWITFKVEQCVAMCGNVWQCVMVTMWKTGSVPMCNMCTMAKCDEYKWQCLIKYWKYTITNRQCLISTWQCLLALWKFFVWPKLLTMPSDYDPL